MNAITEITYQGPFGTLSSSPASFSVTIRDICTKELDERTITNNTNYYKETIKEMPSKGDF